jgi:hypothetical protein
VLFGDTVSVPLVAFVPVQPPEAVHEVALIEDQITSEALPEVTLVGLAEKDTLGTGLGQWGRSSSRRKSTKFRRLPTGASSVEKSVRFTATAPAVVITLATTGPDTAGEASTNGERAIVNANDLTNRALAA